MTSTVPAAATATPLTPRLAGRTYLKDGVEGGAVEERNPTSTLLIPDPSLAVPLTVNEFE